MMNQVQIYTEERKISMNYQSKKTPGFYNADYKTPKSHITVHLKKVIQKVQEQRTKKLISDL
jgi:hypothetical protein